MAATHKTSQNERSLSPVFLRSSHVERDAQAHGAVSRYVLTSNASRAIRRITEAIKGGQSTVWTLTGPYGTGKSAFLIFLSHLLGPKRNDLTTRSIEILRQADPDLAKVIFTTWRHRFDLLPIRLSASNEPIADALIRAISQANKQGILRIGVRQDRELRKLERMSRRGEQIEDFRVVALIESIIAPASSKDSSSLRILLLIDEMGKLLEYAAINPHASNVFLFQQLAELAARSNGHLVLLAALHQDFRVYASALTSADRVEWEKIRGRFEDILFEEPPAQLLRFVAAAWQRTRDLQGIERSSEDIASVRTLAPELWELGISPAGLGLEEGIKLLVNCAPLHPIVSVLLGPLFRRVGQNERSAFSFLQSEEPHSLQMAMNRRATKGGLYRPEDLYRYLISSLGNALLNTPDAKRWAEALEAESRHPQLTRDAISVLRTIAILAIASRWINIKASTNVVKNALSGQLNSEEVSSALHELQSASLIVHRRYNDSYVLWEGSDVDVEARLAEGRDRVRNNDSTVSILRDGYQLNPALARRHAFKTGTLRFFDVRFCSPSELPHMAAPRDHDGVIVIVIPNTLEEHRLTLQMLPDLDNRTIVRLLDSSGPFVDLALELGALRWAQTNTPELSNDSTARRELYSRLLAIQALLDERTKELLSDPDPLGGKWYDRKGELHIRSSRDLNEHLSNRCDEIFSKAPKIDNEIINRRELSSAAAAARRNLIERMIECSSREELGICGNPPERSIFRSMLGKESLGLHRQLRGEWAFRKPTARSGGFEVVAEIERYFDSATEQHREVANLFDLLKAPPFGLREGPIPILFCAALLMRDADVALYNDGAFCPKLTPALMERLIKSPDLFSIRRWKINGVRGRVFEQLEKLVLGSRGGGSPSKNRMLQVARPLMRFIATLPEYTIATSELSMTAKAVRDAFTQATEPDALLFEQLPTACGLSPFKSGVRSRNRDQDIHRFAKCVRSAFEELRAAYPALIDSVRISLADAFGLSSTKPQSIHSRLRSLVTDIAEYAVERDLKMLVDRIVEDADDDDESWLESVASLIAERPLTKWRDEDRPHFSVRLRQFVRRIHLLSATVASRSTNAKQGTTQSIRLSLTSTDAGQFDHVVHIDSNDAKRLKQLETALERQVRKAPDTTMAIAAMARVTQRLLTTGDNSKHGG